MARIVRESVHDHDRRWETRYDKIVRCILGRCGTCAQEAAFGIAFVCALDVCGSPGRPKLLHGYDPGITEWCPPHETLALRMIHIQAIPDMHDRSGKNSTCLHHVARSIDGVFGWTPEWRCPTILVCVYTIERRTEPERHRSIVKSKEFCRSQCEAYVYPHLQGIDPEVGGRAHFGEAHVVRNG